MDERSKSRKARKRKMEKMFKIELHTVESENEVEKKITLRKDGLKYEEIVNK